MSSNDQTSSGAAGRTLETWLEGVRQGWPDDDVGRLIVHGLPRWFHALDRTRQTEVLEERPGRTGSKWDALLAATVEHLCDLHGHPVPVWVDEPERFLEETWVLATTPVIRRESLLYAPPAFIRHGAIPDPADLDERGGERFAWVL